MGVAVGLAVECCWFEVTFLAAPVVGVVAQTAVT